MRRVTAKDMHAMLVDDPGSEASSSLFAKALAAACLFHLILILGVSFVAPDTDHDKPLGRQLEVILLRQAAPTDEKPEVADAFAQVDRVGSGVEEPRETEMEPILDPEPEIPEPDQAFALPPPPLLEPAPPEPQPPSEPELLARTEPAPDPVPILELQPSEPLKESPHEPAPPQVTAAQILASRNLEIAELTARIQDSSAAYASRKRRKAISASTQEYRYASYMEAWRRKVEAVGNLNYPEEAKRHKMYGNLILHVAIRADGTVERIRVIRSSGFKMLDEAAVKIVDLAAPFAPFPPDIRAETDILDITRTWHFLSNNRLGWEN